MTTQKYLTRMLFLETVAGVPVRSLQLLHLIYINLLFSLQGMVGGMVRHLKSLRDMKRDYGWIHTLLEEAENERMHLLTFLEVIPLLFVSNPLTLLTFALLSCASLAASSAWLCY